MKSMTNTTLNSSAYNNRTSSSFKTNRSTKTIEEVAAKSLSRMSRIQGIFTDEDDLQTAWIALGSYISKCLRSCKGVAIPKLGTFTFTAPEFKLEGVTNPHERDRRVRKLVFAISRQFLPGKDIKQGIYIKHKGQSSRILEYSNFGVNGEIPIQKMNAVEISLGSNLRKDCVSVALQRIIKHLSQKVYVKDYASVQIPNVGTLFIRKGLAAVRFNQTLARSILYPGEEYKQDVSLPDKHRKSVDRLFDKLHLKKNTLDYIENNFADGESVLIKQYPHMHFGMKGIKEAKELEDKLKQQQKRRQQEQLIAKYRVVALDRKFRDKVINALKSTLDTQIVTKSYVIGLFQAQDTNKTGYISQLSMKQILQKLGLRLTPQEFVQIARTLSTDSQLNLKYSQLIQQLFPSRLAQQKLQWCQQTQKDIRQWFVRSKLVLKEAFKLIDSDNDGYLSQKDLSMFLVGKLKYISKNTTSVRLQALLHKHDKDRKGGIDFACFSKLINASNRYTKEWVVRAQNQICLALARAFPNLQKAFSNISKNQNKLPLAQLKNWIKSNTDYNDQLITDLMIDLDVNCRGYLNEGQFKKLFSSATWRTQLAVDLIDILQGRFQTPKQAYQFMANHRDLDYFQFTKSIEILLGTANHYNKKDYEELWLALSGKDKVLTLERFTQLIGTGHSGVWQYGFPPKAHQIQHPLPYSEEELLVVKLAKNRKLLIQRLQPFSRKGVVGLEVVQRISAQLMREQNLRFEDQIYRKVIERTGGLVNRDEVYLRKLEEGLKVRAQGDLQFPRDCLRYCC